MSNLRDLILSKPDLKEEIVEIPEWGLSVKVRGMTAKQRSRMLKASFIDGGVVLDLMYPALVIGCVCDPETNEPIFEPGDEEAIMAKSGEIVERLSTIAMRLSGMSADAGIGKN